MAWLGLGLMVASVILIDEKNDFPGWRAAAPVIGTAFTLASISFGGSPALSWLRRPLMVAIGKRSYSLYL
jgi:peptidoglycan/LPS O-acetylase OafA/YrhL